MDSQPKDSQACAVPPELRKPSTLHAELHCPSSELTLESSATEAPTSPLPSGSGALSSSDSQITGAQPQDDQGLDTPNFSNAAGQMRANASSCIALKDTQSLVQRKQEKEQKPVVSDFVLSADAPPYTPQSSTAKQTVTTKARSYTPRELPGLGFVRAFPPTAEVQDEGCLHGQSRATSEVTAGRPAKRELKQPNHLASEAAAGRETQHQSATAGGSRKASGNVNALTTNFAVPLKFCKFLIGEDVAGFLVGRKGVGIEEFQSRNGPGLKVSVSKRGELFPCLLERTATAVGVGDGLNRALLEVSLVALDRAMHKEEERRIDNGKKIGKPKGCFKLVVPESALSHLFLPDSKGRVPVLEVAKKHGVEVLSSAQGGYLHNKMHPLGLKETVLQIIGTADEVPGATVDLASLYQGDPSLPSCLHLNYSHAHFAATPPPPPTPPPSPVLTNGCCPRLSPHFAHPAAVLQLANGHHITSSQPIPSGYQLAGGQHALASSSCWSPTAHSTPLLHSLRSSANSQASMLCVPSSTATTDSIAPPQLPTQDQLVGAYTVSETGSGFRGRRQNGRDKTAHSAHTLAEGCLPPELQQQLGISVAGAGVTGPSVPHSLSSSVPPYFTTGWQQQDPLDQQQRSQQRLHTAGPPVDWQNLQLLTQLCVPRVQVNRANEDQSGAGAQLQQSGLLHHLEELQQSLLVKHLLQLQLQQYANKMPPKQAEEMNSSRVQSLQQLKQQIQMLQHRHASDHQDEAYRKKAAPSRPMPHNEKHPMAISQQLQQQHLQQPHSQQHMEQPLQLLQHQCLSQSLDGLQPSFHTWPQQMPAATCPQELAAFSEPGFEQLQRLQQTQQMHQMQQLHELTAGQQNLPFAKLKRLEAELLQQPQPEAAQVTQLLSPSPPPHWAPVPQHPPQLQADWRTSVASARCSPSEGSQEATLQPQPQQQSGFLPEVPTALADKDAAHTAKATSSAEFPVQPTRGQCGSFEVRKLLEELLCMIGPNASGEVPDGPAQGALLPSAKPAEAGSVAAVRLSGKTHFTVQGQRMLQKAEQ